MKYKPSLFYALFLAGEFATIATETDYNLIFHYQTLFVTCYIPQLSHINFTYIPYFYITFGIDEKTPVRTLAWHYFSPDLKPIIHLWDGIQRHFSQLQPRPTEIWQ